MSKRYKVVGSAPILDHKPGDTFEADLDETNESFLIGIGGLAIHQDTNEKRIEEQAKRLNVESYNVKERKGY